MMRLFVFFAAILLFAASAQAAPLTDKQKLLLSRVQTYLNGVKTMTADFVQISPDGSLASGKFFLKRPGRLRWQYDPPTPILIVADGTFVNIHDYELNEVSKLPISNTLVSFLAQNTISFGGTAKVVEVEGDHEAVRVSIAQADRPEDGTLTLVFSDKPLMLRKMTVKDGAGQATQVSFNDARFGTPLEAKLFEFEDPKLGKKRPK